MVGVQNVAGYSISQIYLGLQVLGSWSLDLVRSGVRSWPHGELAGVRVMDTEDPSDSSL